MGPEAHAARPLVVARRWDQLGGRLGAILNALSIAELFDLEFRFVWPRGADTAINDPRQLFGEAYLHAFEMQPAELEGRPVLAHRELLVLSRVDAERKLSDELGDLFVDTDECFTVVRCAWENAETAVGRFRLAWDKIGWSDRVQQLLATCAQLPINGDVAAVHVRAGDIVNGDWRQVVVHEKYLPTPFIENAIQRLTHDGHQRVLVLSDNAEYLRWLRSRFPRLITAAELVPGYAALTELQQALADIAVLAQCDQIVGPPSSAFSRVAANLGPGRVVRADELVPAGEERECLLAGIDAGASTADGSTWSRGLVARDICWCLDVFGDTMPLARQRELARQAVELDPEFSGAAARFARVSALSDDLRAAAAAASSALQIAEQARRGADPLLEALATDVAVKCFAQLRAAPPRRLSVNPLRPRGRSDRADQKLMDTSLSEIRQSFGRCLELHPFWSVREQVFDALESLISLVERLAEELPATRRRAARVLARADHDDIQSRRPPFASLEDHRSVDMYDPLTRDLNRMAFHLCEALNDVIASADGRA